MKRIIASLLALCIAAIFTSCNTPAHAPGVDKNSTSGAPTASSTIAKTPESSPYLSDTTNITTTTSSTVLPTTVPKPTDIVNSTKHIHKYKSVVSKPDCITSGYTTYTCDCGHNYQDDYAKPLGHKWPKWTTVKEATTSTEGQRVRSCSVCNLTDYVNIPQLPPRFTKAVGVCKTDNVKYETAHEGEFEYAAVAEMYVCSSDDTKAEAKLKKEFKKAFGFAATAKVTKKYIGRYIVDGWEDAQSVYCYQIYDTTYPLCDNEMYAVYHQMCSDGSPWVGFCVYGTLDTYAAETLTTRYQKLEKQMLEEFEKVVGKSIEEMEEFPDKYSILQISQAGTMRTKDGTLVDVLYILCRSHKEP